MDATLSLGHVYLPSRVKWLGSGQCGNALARPVWFLPDTLCVQARIVIPYLQQLAGRGRLRKSF